MSNKDFSISFRDPIEFVKQWQYRGYLSKLRMVGIWAFHYWRKNMCDVWISTGIRILGIELNCKAFVTKYYDDEAKELTAMESMIMHKCIHCSKDISDEDIAIGRAYKFPTLSFSAPDECFLICDKCEKEILKEIIDNNKEKINEAKDKTEVKEKQRKKKIISEFKKLHGVKIEKDNYAITAVYHNYEFVYDIQDEIMVCTFYMNKEGYLPNINGNSINLLHCDSIDIFNVFGVYAVIFKCGLLDIAKIFLPHLYGSDKKNDE